MMTPEQSNATIGWIFIAPGVASYSPRAAVVIGVLIMAFAMWQGIRERRNQA